MKNISFMVTVFIIFISCHFDVLLTCSSNNRQYGSCNRNETSGDNLNNAESDFSKRFDTRPEKGPEGLRYDMADLNKTLCNRVFISVDAPGYSFLSEHIWARVFFKIITGAYRNESTS